MTTGTQHHTLCVIGPTALMWWAKHRRTFHTHYETFTIPIPGGKFQHVTRNRYAWRKPCESIEKKGDEKHIKAQREPHSDTKSRPSFTDRRRTTSVPVLRMKRCVKQLLSFTSGGSTFKVSARAQSQQNRCDAKTPPLAATQLRVWLNMTPLGGGAARHSRCNAATVFVCFLISFVALMFSRSQTHTSV